MKDRFALTKAEKRELIESIDGLLDLMFIPIGKSADDEIGAVEKRIGDLMTSEWDDVTKAAIIKAANAISAGDGSPDKAEVEKLIAVLKEELGPGFQAQTPKEVTELVGAAYVIGKQGVGKEVGATMTLKLEDEQAQQILKKHHLFWVGNYYDDTLGEKIAATVNDVALKQGLGRKEIGKELMKALGDDIANTKPEHYWRLLGAAAVHRARNFGGVSGLIDAEVDEYEILSVMDERTSTICRAMDGKVFKVEHAAKQRDAILAAKTPEDVKSIAPWHTARETPDGGFEIRANGSKQWVNIGKLDAGKMAGRGLALPPYHGFCRTTYIVRSFKESWSTSPDPMQFEYEKSNTTPGIPPEDELKYSKSGKDLGGAGIKDIYTDKSGAEYIFKPAISKAGKKEDFRAYVQEAAAQIQKIAYDGNDYVDVKAYTLSGRFGTVQPKLDIVGDLKTDQEYGGLSGLTPDMLQRIQAEHVIDWLISNHDSHGGNFVVTKAGKVLGIDKEQGFRYFPNDKLDWKYHPNSSYGEQEPIYNSIYQHWMIGDIDLNANAILKHIKRIEAIGDDDYKAMLKPYADARFTGKEKDAQAFLDTALTRKKSLRKDFEGLYSRILTEKIGQKYAFKFVDEMPAKDFLQAPMAVQWVSKRDYMNMTNKALKELGKAKKVAYFQQMNKDELAEALAFPEKSAQISAMVKERTRAKAALSRGEGGTPAAPAPKVGKKPSVDPFEDLDALGSREFGYGLQKDGVLLEGQHVNVRKIFNGITDEYQISFKLLPDHLERVDVAIKAAGGKVTKQLAIQGGGYDKSGKFLQTKTDAVSISSRNVKANIDGAIVTFYNDYNARAYRGRVDIAVDGYDGKDAAKKLNVALQKLGLDAIAHDPTAEDEKLLKLARLLAQERPALAGKLTAKDRTVENISKQLKKEKIDPDQVDRWEKREVWPGYFTYVDEEGFQELRKAGAEYLFAGVTSKEGIMAVLRGGNGMMSTTERYRNGAIVGGSSSSADIRTGGAEQVFTRLVTKNNRGKDIKFNSSHSGGPYVIKIKPEVLARTDWYAFDSDKFGASEDYEARKGRVEIVNTLMSNWRSGNEVMFRHGIALEHFEEVLVNSSHKAAELRNELRSAGVREINGKSLEDFIREGNVID